MTPEQSYFNDIYKIHKGRSFAYTNCRLNEESTHFEWQQTSVYIRDFMNQYYTTHKKCSNCMSIEYYLIFLEKHKNIIKKFRTDSKNVIHFDVHIFNIYKLKEQFTTLFDKFCVKWQEYDDFGEYVVREELNDNCKCLNNKKKQKEHYHEYYQKLDDLEKFLIEPTTELKDTFFKLASKMNKDVSIKIINEANESMLMNSHYCKIQEFINNPLVNKSITNRVFDNSYLSILLYYRKKDCEKTELFITYW